MEIFCHSTKKVAHIFILQRMTIKQLHDNSVTIEVNRLWYRKSSIMQRLHVCKLFNSRQS